MLCGHPRFHLILLEPLPVVPISLRTLSVQLELMTVLTMAIRKIWDTYTGEALHTFSHNHIVRTVALNPQQTPQYLLTVSIRLHSPIVLV